VKIIDKIKLIFKSKPREKTWFDLTKEEKFNKYLKWKERILTK